MPDEFDRIQEREEGILDLQVQAQRAKPRMAKGEPGTCKMCGEDSPRLVGGVCAPCRDKHKLG